MSKSTIRPLWNATLPDHILSIVWSPDAKQLAVLPSTGDGGVFDLTGKLVQPLPAHANGNLSLCWLATGGQDGKIRRGEQVLDAGGPWVEHLAPLEGGYLAVAAGKIVRIFSPAGEVIDSKTFTNTVSGLAWRPGSRTLAIATYGGVKLWDGNLHDTFEWKGSPLVLAWSPNGETLAHGNQDATVHFWTMATNTPLQMSGYAGKVRELAWDSSSRTLATGGSDTVCLWDCSGKGPAGSKPLMLEGHTKTISALSYQKRGHLLASGGKDGMVCIWQLMNRKGALISAYTAAGEITALSWSPDDKRLAIGYDVGVVQVVSM